ncbi:winged helix-turn-helix domain-containing protein [Streptomyces sp. 71268]|uniref:GntR family transcriptional regulator n=1 Tax=Streptomyces sp. 71268 TaxID=3002640 RepID=UPI0023F8DB10|nr:winged helix-turn-helix domain-containing protein [Streptomyces sp. 71268]WEV25655.1 winged helix-turn-helix domain-containing protein [Streptomyces sp. 71268]
MVENSPDPHASRAPYLRVLEAVAADIREGRLQPGARIPSEAQLCEMHGVARETARRAVRVLRERGLVVTEWGKGTYVVDPDEDAN